MIDVDKLAELLETYKGNISAVARHMGVSRQGIYKHLDKSEELRETLQDARETMIDNAETTLYDLALDGNVTALIFFLKTQGHKRGYVERHDITSAGEKLGILYVNDWRNEND